MYVFSTNTFVTTALHSMNPMPHFNNDLSSLSNELNDLIEAHLATLTQEHICFYMLPPSTLLTPTLSFFESYTNNSPNTFNNTFATFDNTLLTNNF
jgi:hypothetical protein